MGTTNSRNVAENATHHPFPAIRKTLIRWYRSNGRRFWWREPSRSEFQIVVSELLLQKTRADLAQDVIRQLISRYASYNDLSEADESEVAEIIHPLGLQRRKSRQLILVAKVARENGGTILEAMKKGNIPGIGLYTSSMIRCMVDGKSVPVVDSNVTRVVSRLFGISATGDNRRDSELWSLCSKLVDAGSAKRINWALIDIGSIVCKPKKPSCEVCPLTRMCRFTN
jgi:A/G-specific adenine glycosylase